MQFVVCPPSPPFKNSDCVYAQQHYNFGIVTILLAITKKLVKFHFFQSILNLHGFVCEFKFVLLRWFSIFFRFAAEADILLSCF